jgi:hypothetical protein
MSQLAAQLKEPMARIQPDALQAYLNKPSHRPQQQGVAAQGGGVETMKSVIEVSGQCFREVLGWLLLPLGEGLGVSMTVNTLSSSQAGLAPASWSSWQHSC